MSHSHLTPLLVLLLIFIWPSLVYGQETTPPQKVQTVDVALQQKALDLLESLAAQISGLQSGENRARIGSNIVGSLWTHDEKRARTLLVSVEEDIRAGLREVPDDPQNAHTIMVFLRLREDTAERVAKYDPEAALAFLKATEVKFEKSRGIEDRDRALSLRLAKLAVVKNPDVALELARQSLRGGISQDLLPLLRQLFRNKQRDHARSLYKEIVAKLHGVDFATDWSSIYFSQSLARSFTPPAVDDSAFRDLINIFIANANANRCYNKPNHEDVYLCREIAQVVPQIEQVDPNNAARLKHLAPIDSGHASRDAYFELGLVAQDGDVDELLSLVAKYPQIAKEIIWRTVWKAEVSGDLERARKIATEYAVDPEHRAAMLEHVKRSQKWAAVDEEAFAEAQRKLDTLSRPMDRIDFLAGFAQRVGARDRTRAVQLLNQAQGIAEAIPEGVSKMRTVMGLAMLFCFEKSNRGFAIMETVVPRLNELIDAAAKLDGYDTQYLRDGEWNMSASGNIGSLLTVLAQGAGYFAWCDFDRAVSLASQFDRNEIRIMAQLKLAQAILAGPPNRSYQGPPRGY